jgi:hypothetical protein
VELRGLDERVSVDAVEPPGGDQAEDGGGALRVGVAAVQIQFFRPTTIFRSERSERVLPAKYLLEGVRAVDRGELLLPWQMAPAEDQAAVKTG